MLVQTIKLVLRLFACYPSLLGLAYDVQFDPISIQTKWCLHVCPSDHDQIGFRPFLCSWPSAKRFMWIFYALWTIFNNTWSMIFTINPFFDIENIKDNTIVNQSSPTIVCLLSLSAWAGWFVLFCGIALHLSPLVTVQTVTWQVKNFGAETTTALSRQKIRMKMGTEIWKMNILYKFEKRLNCISISISIKFSWNGKIQDTIMYYHYDRKIRYLSHWSKSFIAVMSSSSHCNSFLQFSRESKSVWSPGF